MEWPTVCDRQLRYLTPVISDSVFCGQEDEEIMGGTREMKDTAQKDFIAFPDIAADTINALLYQGKALTDAGNLCAGPTETIYQGKEKLKGQYEDLCKYELIDGKVRLMYLIANQTAVDGKMLLRKAGYTGGAYREQYEGKMQDIFPVIEIVLYWGEPRWRSSRNIRRLFAKRKFPEGAWDYIDDLKLHVYEMRHLSAEIRERFQSDMRIIVDFLAEGSDYRSDRKIMHKAALIRMIRVLSGESDTEDIGDWLCQKGIREEDEVTVCELFDQYVKQGREEGWEEGKAEGKARQLVEDIENTMNFFHVTLEKACESLGITVSRYEEAKRI